MAHKLTYYEKVLAAWNRLLAKWRKHHPHPHPHPPHPAPKPSPKPKPKPHPKPSLPIKGCDYVSGPTPAALKAAEIRFVCRYLSTPGNPKNLTAAEAKALHAAGIDIVLVFETTANRALEGKAAGKADYQSARAQATALGCPKTVPIYFAVDFDMQPSQTSKVLAYFAGASSVAGTASVGVYGGIAAVEAVAKGKLAMWFWQAYAWSYGHWYAGNHIEQVQNGASIGGHSVDLDRALKASYGAWKG